MEFTAEHALQKDKETHRAVKAKEDIPTQANILDELKLDKALKLATNWTKKHLPSGGSITIKESKGRTPLILVDIPGQKAGNVLMYGHLDKQH